MKSKRPAKKNAPTPKKKGKGGVAIAKRKYTRRESGVQIPEPPVKVEPFDEGGMKLFAIEKYNGTLYRSGFEMTKEYLMLDALIRKLNPREGFIIKAEWKRYAHVVVKRNELKIQIRVLKIPTMDNYVRVVRVS
jgi:hypothetical protein